MKLRRDGITYIGPVEQPFEAAVDYYTECIASEGRAHGAREGWIDRFEVRRKWGSYLGIASTRAEVLGFWK